MKHLIVFWLCCLPVIVTGQQLPVLCYHNITVPGTHKNDLLHVDRAQFEQQLRTLADSGYHTISPDAAITLLKEGRPIPPRTCIITFDDSHAEHATVAAPLLQHFGLRGVFFVMTVTLNKPRYLTKDQIKTMADQGHVIASHTWDHPHLKLTGVMDWQKQLVGPRQQLEKITGRPVWYFAYPFGEYNDSIIVELKKAGYKAAFQLNRPPVPGNELYTLRRIMVDGNWSGPRLVGAMAVYGTQ